MIKTISFKIDVDYDLSEVLIKTLQHPTVASKSFLITIGDRTVSGMVARDQFLSLIHI